jgi:hypothetical protein
MYRILYSLTGMQSNRKMLLPSVKDVPPTEEDNGLRIPPSTPVYLWKVAVGHNESWYDKRVPFSYEPEKVANSFFRSTRRHHPCDWYT